MAMIPEGYNPWNRRRRGVVNAMTGEAPAFSPPSNVMTAFQEPTQQSQGYPSNYQPSSFYDLAGYEEKRRGDFAKSVQDQLATRRASLSTSLTNQGNELFKAANPGILEDLNSRGLFSSPSAVATAQSNALRDIGLANQTYLNQFDDQSTAASLQAQQDTLDAGLDLRRGGLEQQFQEGQANQEQSLAERLAKQQRQNSLYGSLIGAGGSILGAGALPGGFLGKLFGGGKAGTTATGVAGTAGVAGSGGYGTAASSLFPAGVAAAPPGAAVTGGAVTPGWFSGVSGPGSLVGPAAGVGAGLALYEGGRKLLRKQGADSTTSKVLGALPGVGLSVALANRALGGKAFGGKTQNGNAIADVARNVESQSNQAKELLASGDTDTALRLLSQVRGQVERAATTNNVWASSINPFWQKLQNEGVIVAQNGKWVLAQTGQEIPLG